MMQSSLEDIFVNRSSSVGFGGAIVVVVGTFSCSAINSPFSRASCVEPVLSLGRDSVLATA
jgi:hypothetical protein